MSPWRLRSRSRPRATAPGGHGVHYWGSVSNAVDRLIRLYPYAGAAESSMDESLELNIYPLPFGQDDALKMSLESKNHSSRS
jgi:hypothetical protein